MSQEDLAQLDDLEVEPLTEDDLEGVAGGLRDAPGTNTCPTTSGCPSTSGCPAVE